MMKIINIAQYELGYGLKSIQAPVTFFLLFGIAFLFTANSDEFLFAGPGGLLYANGPYSITKKLIEFSILFTFVIPFFVSSAVLKDMEHKFDGILFCTPISKSSYLFGRFIGAFTLLMVTFSGIPLGMLSGTFWPWANPDMLTNNDLSHYLIVYFVIVMPSMLFTASIVFATTVVSRSVIYAYVASLGLLLFYVVSADLITPLWDPFMLSTLEQQVKYWTVGELNSRLISLDGIVLGNRILWFAISFAVCSCAYLLFSFRVPVKQRPDNQNETRGANIKTPIRFVADIKVKPSWNRHTTYQQLLARTQFEIAAVVQSVPFLLLMGFCSILLVLSLLERDVYYGVNAYPITRLMIDELADIFLSALIAIIVFYSADIIWREREHKINEIIDALPTPNWVFVVSKISALVAVLVCVMILGIGISLAIQIVSGYFQIELSLYLERGLFYLILPFVFLAILSCFFQVLAKNRYFGMLLLGVFIGAIVVSADVLGFRHPLLSYGIPAFPSPLSDMNGSGRFIEGGYWVRAYWASISGMLLILTYVFWNRGTFQSLRYRLAELRQFKSTTIQLSVLILFISFAGVGSFIYYNSNVLNQFYTDEQRRAFKIGYEKQYGQYQSLPMPRTVDIKVDVDIYPYQRRIETRGTHVLLNKTQQDILTVHLSFPFLTQLPVVSLQGATQRFVDSEYQYFIFDLSVPMRPGEKRLLKFETLIQRQGFDMDNLDTRLVRNGSFIVNKQITPHIGYNPDYMLKDNARRKEYGLPVLPRDAKLEDTSQHTNHPIRQDSDFVNFETTVSTIKSQTAVSMGHLEKTWTDGDRRYFTYKMHAPIRNFYSYLSAEYEVSQDHWKGVDIEVFHHKGHRYNVDRMVESVKDSLDYFSSEFSPYQYKQVRIAEFPAYRKFAQAYATTIPYSEGIGFVAQIDEGDVDMPYYVTAHEMAHQWWGHQVTAANTQGANFIHETLAQYSALLVMERKYGKDRIRQFLKFELDQYLDDRSEDAEGELSLKRVESQPYIYYRKGALVMYALKDYLGEDIINRSLRRLITLKAYRSEPYALSTDLIDILKQQSPAEYVSLIEDFLEKITLYDLSINAGNVVKQKDTRFKVILDINVAKYYADQSGKEHETEFDTPVDIGLFLKSPDAKGFSKDDVILLDKYVPDQGKSTMEIIVDKPPVFVGIDPYNKLIDRNSDDNLVEVTMLPENYTAKPTRLRK